MNQRRSYVELMAAILRLGEAGKTQIMYAANMSYAQLQKYLDFLMERGFVAQVSSENSAARYTTTRKGYSLLELLEKVLAMLGDGDPIDSFESNQGPASEA